MITVSTLFLHHTVHALRAGAASDSSLNPNLASLSVASDRSRHKVEYLSPYVLLELSHERNAEDMCGNRKVILLGRGLAPAINHPTTVS